MKKIVALFIICLMVLGITSCVSVGDMEAPNGNVWGTADNQDETQSETKEDTIPETLPETEQPVIDNKQVLKFVAAGDALIHSAIYREAEALAASMPNYKGDYYFNGMYEYIADEIKNADVAFVNHEAPIANTYISGYPAFNAPSESGDALVDLGFNVVNIANNHMFDSDGRTTGYADTIKYWESKNILQIGGYKNQTDYDNIRVLNADGVNIAFLSYTFGVNSGTKMNSVSVNEGYITPLIKDATLVKHIAAAKNVADLVFVSVHWGSENVFNATAEQKRVAKLIADNGADVIIGHHSHTVQPVEWITGTSGNKTLCIYSLGNLISGMLNSKNMVGGLMTFDIVKENGEISIENPVYKPLVCHYEISDFSKKDPEGNPVRTGFKVYMLEDYTEELAKKHGTRNYGTVNLSVFKGYVESTISSEFLPSFLK